MAPSLGGGQAVRVGVVAATTDHVIGALGQRGPFDHMALALLRTRAFSYWSLNLRGSNFAGLVARRCAARCSFSRRPGPASVRTEAKVGQNRHPYVPASNR